MISKHAARRGLVIGLLIAPLALAGQTVIGTPSLAATGEGLTEPRAAGPWDPKGPRYYEPAEISGRAAFDGVSEDVAAARLSLEDDAAVLLEEAARRWPSTFAGSWMADQGDSVVVAFTQSAEANVAELRKTFPRPDRLKAKTTALSMGDLLRLHDRMKVDRNRLNDVAQGRRAAAEVADLPAAMRATKGNYAVDIDVQSNSLLAFAAAPKDELTRALEQRYGAKTGVRPGPGKQECSREFCQFSMRGGLATGEGCTTGFTAFGGSGRRFFLTAGHCGYRFWTHAGSGYGNTDRADEDNFMDAARVVDDSPTDWSHVGRVWVESTDQRVIRFFQLRSNMQMETQILKSGARTGTTRGVVKSLWFSPVGATNDEYVSSTYCSAGGDSGGAVLRNDVAWGLHGGSSVGLGIPCGDPDHYSFFQPIEPALNRLNVSLIAG